MSDKLSPFEKAFVKQYIASGYNGRKAYLELRPEVTIQTADVTASKLLSQPKVKEFLDRQEDKRLGKTLYSRENLTKKAYEIAEKAETAGEYTGALKGIELTGKLQRLFDSETPDVQGYQVLMQQLVVNVTPAKPEHENDKVIEVKSLQQDNTSSDHDISD